MVPGPFESVGVAAPPRRGDPNAGPDVATRTTGVTTFYWTIADFVESELLPFVFADAEDERQQYTMVIHNVVRKLKLDGEPVGDDGAWQHRRRDDHHVPRAGRADRRPAVRRR